MQSLIKLLYPPQCVMCDDRTEIDFALCGSCWADTPFIDGLCCDACGAPLPGDDASVDGLLCDDCMVVARPWTKGRAVLVYRDKARRLILSLKHGILYLKIKIFQPQELVHQLLSFKIR